MLTSRLEVRLPEEADRSRFIELFSSEEFMVFSGCALSTESASKRFDDMLRVAREVPFAKQPIVERASRRLVGYSGVDWFEFGGERRLEFGYRLVPEVRGRGYATEASLALLALAEMTFSGELLAMIDSRNTASINTIHKLGFEFWKEAAVNSEMRNLYTYQVG